jgi:hypothetical protein
MLYKELPGGQRKKLNGDGTYTLIITRAVSFVKIGIIIIIIIMALLSYT